MTEIILPCPHCKRQPSIEKCEPFPGDVEEPGWYVGCYQRGGGVPPTP
jgi:hypothetical protein